MSSVLKNFLILFTLIALGVFGYILFFNADSSTIVSSDNTGGINSQAAFQTREFKAILNDLNTINLASPLLQDSRFLQLKDHNQVVSERPYGRVNPFVSSQ